MSADRPPIPDLLDRAALALEGLAGAANPWDNNGKCPLCLTVDDHDPDCPWQIGRRTAPSDVVALRRLARALRYGPAGASL